MAMTTPVLLQKKMCQFLEVGGGSGSSSGPQSRQPVLVMTKELLPIVLSSAGWEFTVKKQDTVS